MDVADTTVTLAFARAPVVSDNIHARSFALLTHRLCSLRSLSPLAYIIARLCLASLRSWEVVKVYDYVELEIKLKL